MEPSDLLNGLLWFVVTLGVLTVVNSVLAGLAFRVNLGNSPWPLDPGDFWWRCLLAAAILSAYLAVAYYCTFVPIGPEAAAAFWLLMAPYPAVGAFLFSWAFALDDPLEGFKLFLLHHIVPVLLLLLTAFFSPSVSAWLYSLSPWK